METDKLIKYTFRPSHYETWVFIPENIYLLGGRPSGIKAEHLCKTIIKGVQDWEKTEISTSAVFEEKNTSFKRNKAFTIKKNTFSDLLAMYCSHSYDENTSRWILVHHLFLYYILTTSKQHPNYENVHPNYEKGHPYCEKLHPIYEQTTSQLRKCSS